MIRITFIEVTLFEPEQSMIMDGLTNVLKNQSTTNCCVVRGPNPTKLSLPSKVFSKSR